MLNKIAKLEEKLNGLLIKFFGLFGRLFHRIIPQIIFTKTKQFQTNIKEFITKVFQAAFNSIKTVLFFLLGLKDKIFNFLELIQSYPLKSKLIGSLFACKNFLFTTKPKDYLNILRQSSKSGKDLIQKKMGPIDNKQFKMLSVSLSLFVVGGVGVYYGASSIFKNEFPSRAPANIQEYDYRPEYKLYPQKIIKIQNIKVPIIAERVGKVDNITIDFGLRLSTRFAGYYISEYEYKLKDYFFTGVEPVISDFPMEEEGKQVLKEKIQIEINKFLKDNNVEGHVEDVYILYIVGS